MQYIALGQIFPLLFANFLDILTILVQNFRKKLVEFLGTLKEPLDYDYIILIFHQY